MADRCYPISCDPCLPNELAGRDRERKKIFESLRNSTRHGQVLMISGTHGSGKTSLLDWAEEMIQQDPNCFTIKDKFLETPGNILNIYRKLLYELKGHEEHGKLRQIMANPHVQTAMKVALGTFDNVTRITDLKEFIKNEDSGYDILCSEFLEVLSSVSQELIKNKSTLSILIDDVQWSSKNDFMLLKDVIRELPRNISLIFTYNLQDETRKYDELQRDFVGFNFSEIQLGYMSTDEVKDFAKIRGNLTIDDSVAEFLGQQIDEPLTLAVAFNLLHHGNLEPTTSAFQQILPEALKHVKSIYSGLNRTSRSWVNSLCVLESPMPLSLMGCMLDEPGKLSELRDAFEDSNTFREIDNEYYDFSVHALREYCKERLPEGERQDMDVKATECSEKLKDELPEDYYKFSIAEHAYKSGQAKAYDMNYELGEDLKDLSEPDLALRMSDRAEKSAENMGKSELVADASSQKGEVLESMSRHDEALNSYKNSRKISEETGDIERKADVQLRIGNVYDKLDNPEKALDSYEDTLNISEETDNIERKADAQFKIGNTYNKLDNPEKASDYYEDSLKTYKETDNPEGEENTLSQIDNIYKIGEAVESNLDMDKVRRTDVIKDTGEKEPFKPEKIRKSVEKAVTDAGFKVKDKVSTIKHVSSDAMNLAVDKKEISSKEIRNEIVNNLESDVPEAAQAWREHERQMR